MNSYKTILLPVSLQRKFLCSLRSGKTTHVAHSPPTIEIQYYITIAGHCPLLLHIAEHILIAICNFEHIAAESKSKCQNHSIFNFKIYDTNKLPFMPLQLAHCSMKLYVN